MPLQSTLFRDDTALQACSTNDRAHITLGASGEHVSRLHFSLFAADGLGIEESELSDKRYGQSTAAAVLAYKTRRSIINPAYQSKPDDIVGKMTITALDRDMLSKQGQSGPQDSSLCGSDPLSALTRLGSPGLQSEAVVGASVQNASVRNALVGAPPSPNSKQPHETALARVGVAQLAIAQTRSTLAALISFRPIINQPFSGGSLPFGTLVLFDKVWRNFGQPIMPISTTGVNGIAEFPPIKTLADFLGAIDSHYAFMQGVLGQAASLFRTMKQADMGKTTFGWTLVQPPGPGDPPVGKFADGIYFGDVFNASSQGRQIEVVVHEASHFKNGHQFLDTISFSSENWGKFDGQIGILNAWSYSMFVLDVVFGRTTPFPP